MTGHLCEAGVFPKEIEDLLDAPFSNIAAGTDWIARVEVGLAKLDLEAEVSFLLFLLQDRDALGDVRLVGEGRSVGSRGIVTGQFVGSDLHLAFGEEPGEKLVLSVLQLWAGGLGDVGTMVRVAGTAFFAASLRTGCSVHVSFRE